MSQRPETDRLATTGVVLEQHPDRARLFMQWHEMGWPLLWDPFNLLEFPVVPVTYLLYYVCEGAAGVCVYLRQDLEIPIPITTSDAAVGLAG